MVSEPLARKLPGGEVDAHARRPAQGELPRPRLDLRASLRQSPIADGKNQPALLGGGNEVARRDKSAFWMTPADEGFEADDFACTEVDFRLVVKHKFIPLEGPAQ